jgi:hypothetical protein
MLHLTYSKSLETISGYFHSLLALTSGRCNVLVLHRKYVTSLIAAAAESVLISFIDQAPFKAVPVYFKESYSHNEKEGKTFQFTGLVPDYQDAEYEKLSLETSRLKQLTISKRIQREKLSMRRWCRGKRSTGKVEVYGGRPFIL